MDGFILYMLSSIHAVHCTYNSLKGPLNQRPCVSNSTCNMYIISFHHSDGPSVGQCRRELGLKIFNFASAALLLLLRILESIWDWTENEKKRGCTLNTPQCSTQSRTNPNKALFNGQIIQITSNHHRFASTPLKRYNDTTWKETTRSRPVLPPTASKCPCIVANLGSHSEGIGCVNNRQQHKVKWKGFEWFWFMRETWNNNRY